MTKQEQIEELAKAMCEGCANHDDCEYDICEATLDEAQRLYDGGFRKVVLCDHCYLQGNCVIEDAFNSARFSDSMKFCAAGQQRPITLKD